METSQIVIAQDGDVVLALTQNQDKSYSVRVSSMILSYASPVFKSMLGPVFREGQDSRSFSNPKHINLPDDDATAMIRLCKILHFNQSTNGDSPLQHAKTAEILMVAILADKYDCLRVASPPLQVVLLELSVLPEPTDDRNDHSPADLAAAAYLLHLDGLCQVYARRMVLDMDESFLPLLKRPVGQILGGSFLLVVGEQRTFIRHELIQRVDDLPGYQTSCTFAECTDPLLGPHTFKPWHDYLAEQLSIVRWPTNFPIECAKVYENISLRTLLGRFGHVYLECVKLRTIDSQGYTVLRDLSEYSFRELAYQLDRAAFGVCCAFARDEFRSECCHEASRLDMPKRDPIIPAMWKVRLEWPG